MRTALTLLFVTLVGCGSAPADPELSALLDRARAGEYLTWRREPAPHVSMGPHGGTVRTFVNPTLEAPLLAGERTFPPGSIALKELFSAGKRTGWAIDWKGDDGEWRFFEGFEPTLDQYFYRGTENGCAGCHRPGIDFLLTAPGHLGITDAP
jgi:hypothetical protein